MTRALREYEVPGIRTSLPFFRWMLREPAFARGEFHTGYLDELLQPRRGEPFETPDLSMSEVAAMAAGAPGCRVDYRAAGGHAACRNAAASRAPAGASRPLRARMEGHGAREGLRA